MKASFPAMVTKVMTMADKTIRIQADCQEMAPETMAEIFSLRDSLCYVYLDDKVITQIDKSDVPELKMEKWEKPPSQRLRAVLYRIWENRIEQKKTDLQFETWYRERMESIINKAKEQLD